MTQAQQHEPLFVVGVIRVIDEPRVFIQKDSLPGIQFDYSLAVAGLPPKPDRYGISDH